MQISTHVDRAIALRSNSDQAGHLLQADHLPIFGIAKEALLAIRYRLEDGQVRYDSVDELLQVLCEF